MPNVCPECDRPIYFRKKDKPELMKCYVCKKWVKPIKRGYKKANRYAVCKRWDEIPRRRKTFISDSDLVSHDELVERLKEYKANNKRLTKRNKALIAILYLTGARVEEITGMIDQVTREKVTEPLKLNQMEFKLMDGDMYLVFDRLRVLKRKPRKDASGNPQEIVRRVPVLVQDDTYMVACIKEYVHSFKRVALDMPLFKITYQRAWQISNEFFGKFNHYWRHLRLTHLVDQYEFTDLELQQYVGWNGTQMASKYTHLNWGAIARKMRKNPIFKPEHKVNMDRLKEKVFDSYIQNPGINTLKLIQDSNILREKLEQSYSEPIKKSIKQMPITWMEEEDLMRPLEIVRLASQELRKEGIYKSKIRKKEKKSYLRNFKFDFDMDLTGDSTD